MKAFILGFVAGTLFATAIAWAGNFYDSSGQPKAPQGSIQQFDYFRQRQQYLDLGAMRRNSDEQRLHPCGR